MDPLDKRISTLSNLSRKHKMEIDSLLIRLKENSLSLNEQDSRIKKVTDAITACSSSHDKFVGNAIDVTSLQEQVDYLNNLYERLEAERLQKSRLETQAKETRQALEKQLAKSKIYESFIEKNTDLRNKTIDKLLERELEDAWATKRSAV